MKVGIFFQYNLEIKRRNIKECWGPDSKMPYIDMLIFKRVALTYDISRIVS